MSRLQAVGTTPVTRTQGSHALAEAPPRELHVVTSLRLYFWEFPGSGVISRRGWGGFGAFLDHFGTVFGSFSGHFLG